MIAERLASSADIAAVAQRDAGPLRAIAAPGATLAANMAAKRTEKTPTKKRATAPSKSELVGRGEASLKADAASLGEAIRRGRAVVDAAESAVASYGQWLFATLFASDTKSVLDRAIEQPTFDALLEAAESPTLPLGRGVIRVALRVAAFDKRLADEPWSRLHYSHKVELLPLGEPKLMRAAARHVLAASLHTPQVRLYVQRLLKPDGVPPKLSPTTAVASIERFAGRFDRPRSVEKYATNLSRLADDKRDASLERIEVLVERLQRVVELVKDSRKARR